MLNVRAQRVVKLERRGVRAARALARAGACGSNRGGGDVTYSAAGTLITPRSGGGDAGGAAGSETASAPPERAKSPDTAPDSGDVRGESEAQLPPPLGGGDRAEPGGVSLVIGIALILLALLAGFATPHLRGRLPSS